MSKHCIKCDQYQLAMAYLQKDVKRMEDKVKSLERELKKNV